ncbi:MULTISPECIES: heavy metal sensor histidine kinase [Pandoraea]|uniref:heavy metal sensor histidine kinase n=1 Tax=Pandoraea TaxID=93217 RepID=UPI001F5C5FCB|nr:MULTISPECIES: heavy metal sensor histidine kinase [Pandoraea]MCI3204156.1 two-component sensor histidine kinase [Pandoraea sp. LA3]MDN4582182.1 two-component sensor histidine kinase [Pandoraea capi]
MNFSLRARRTRSLRARLTFIIAACEFMVLALILLYQYFALSEQLRVRAHQDLLGTVTALRHELGSISTKAEIGADPRRWYDATHGHQNLDFAVLDTDGKTLVASRGYRSATGELTRVGSGKTPGDDDVHRLGRGKPGERLQYVAADAVIGDGGADAAHVVLVVQMDSTERLAVLTQFALTALAVQIAGTVLIGALTFWLVTLGLRPLQRLTRAAEQVSSERLGNEGEPLPEDDIPAELRDLTHAFNRMLARLNESFTRLSQFSSDLAHDLRTPISNMMGEAQVALSRERPPAEYRAVLVSAIEECERLSHMISTMLFLARAESAHTEIRREASSLAAIAVSLVEDFLPMAEEAGLGLTVEGDATAEIDRALVRRALANVLVNAIRHSRAGSVILVSCTTTPGHARIRVHNVGDVIAPEHLPRIFDRLYRVDPSRHNEEDARTGGTGLGLAIVKSIVELHGGEVTASSDARNGTSLVLSFPLRADVKG